MVVDIPEVNLGIGRQEGAGAIGQDAERVSLGGEVASEVQNETLDREYLAQRVLVELGEDPLLEAVHELVELVDDREISVDRLVHDCMHELGGTVGRQLRFSL